MSAVELAIERYGQEGAPPLILGGSLGTPHEMWEPQRAALAERFDVIAYDTRGHGRSPVPPGPYSIAELGQDVAALMDGLGLERASFCGLSIGGMVGQWLAVNAPERIDRLILICTTARVTTGEVYRERARAVREAGSAEVVADAVIERWFTPGFAHAHADVVVRHRAMIAATPAEGYAACAEAVAGHDERAGLRDVRTPTLVMAGAQDAAIAPEQARALADTIPGARFELLDPAAHLASVERIEAVTGLIIDHLEKP
jgi:3-oxoadipate enol-lactonase